MFGLSVMLTMTLSGHSWIINKICTRLLWCDVISKYIRSKEIRNGPDQVLSQEMENPYFQFFRAFTRTNFDWSFTQISVKTSYKDLPKQRKLIYLLKY